MPRIKSSEPKVMRSSPETVSMPDAGEQKSERHRDHGLVLVLATEAHEGTEGQEIDREELRRPEFECEGGDQRRQKRDQENRDQRAYEGGRECCGERLGRLPPAAPSDSRRTWSPPTRLRREC